METKTGNLESGQSDAFVDIIVFGTQASFSHVIGEFYTQDTVDVHPRYAPCFGKVLNFTLSMTSNDGWNMEYVILRFNGSEYRYDFNGYIDGTDPNYVPEVTVYGFSFLFFSSPFFPHSLSPDVKPRILDRNSPFLAYTLTFEVTTPTAEPVNVEITETNGVVPTTTTPSSLGTFIHTFGAPSSGIFQIANVSLTGSSTFGFENLTIDSPMYTVSLFFGGALDTAEPFTLLKRCFHLILFYLFFFLSLNIYFTHIEPCANGIEVGEFCSCNSGFTGISCRIADPTCTLEPVDALETEAVAEFMTSQSSLSGNSFSFTIESPGRDGRVMEDITLAQNETCGFMSGRLAKGFLPSPDCKDSFSASFPLPEVLACGFTLETPGSPDFYSYLGSIDVRVSDHVGFFRSHSIDRHTLSSLQIRLNLPSQIALSVGNLTVVSEIEILAAVTFQSFDPELDQAVIIVTSSVQWPYALSSPAFSGTDRLDPFSIGVSFETNCSETEGDCVQVTTLTINNILGSLACDFDGVYNLTWSYTCRSGLDDCPLSAPGSSSVSLDLTSGNLCGSFEIQSSLFGTMAAYLDNSFTNEALAFLAGERIYLAASFSADVEIQEVQVMNTTILPSEGTPLQVVREGSATGAGGDISFVGVEGTPAAGEARFSFLATYGETNQIFSSAGPQVVSFTVEASFLVTYRTSFKRDIQMDLITLKKALVLDAVKVI